MSYLEDGLSGSNSIGVIFSSSYVQVNCSKSSFGLGWAPDTELGLK